MKDVIIPVKITLRTGLDGPVCSFTAHIPFVFPPLVGHKLLIDYSNEFERFNVVVHEVYHFLPTNKSDDASCLVVTLPLILEDYDVMLHVLDWFKAIYKVEDFSSDSTQPEPYYSFYRSLVNVLGVVDVPSPKVAYEPTAIKVFAECCRAVALAELDLEGDELLAAIPTHNEAIQALHTMVLERKKDEKTGADMLLLVKWWDSLINGDKKIMWHAPIKKCVAVAAVIFGRLPSVPPDALPEPLRA